MVIDAVPDHRQPNAIAVGLPDWENLLVCRLELWYGVEPGGTNIWREKSLIAERNGRAGDAGDCERQDTAEAARAL